MFGVIFFATFMLAVGVMLYLTLTWTKEEQATIISKDPAGFDVKCVYKTADGHRDFDWCTTQLVGDNVTIHQNLLGLWRFK